MIARVDTKLLTPVVRGDLERVGHRNDGGYIVPADAVGAAASLLSFGLAYDWDFERAFRKRNRGAVIRCWDHTTTPVGALRRLRFLDYRRFFRDEAVHVRRRVGPDTIGEAFASVEKHAPTFVKMDIEGAEYDVWSAAMERQASIDAMVVEFHDLDDRAEELNACMTAAREHFHVVHVHGNNYGARTDYGFPCVVEVTLEHKRRFSAPPEPCKRVYPVAGLDTPNDPTRPDYELAR